VSRRRDSGRSNPLTASATTTFNATASRPVRKILGLFPWPAQVSHGERNALIAGGLGWMLDAMDVMLYSMVLAHLMTALSMSKSVGGLLTGLTLGASAMGGLIFGFVADRVGRTRALMASILAYSLATGACGLSQTVVELAIFRVILGLGMGGEWTTGAALIAETWPPEHRGKALGLMQSSWAIGEMAAAGVAGLILPRFGWRAVFFAGVLPALAVFWILRAVPESELWRARGAQKRGSWRALLQPGVREPGVIATAMNACGMFGYWGLFTWIPAFLTLPAAQGGRGLGLIATTWWLVFMGIGKWLGYTLFGFFADSVGRRKSYATYLLIAAALVPIYGMSRSPAWLLILGLPVAFFGTGYFSGYAAITSELFPTEVRATAMGLSYNIGRGFSALAPLAVGAIAAHYSFTVAFYLLAGSFFLSAMLSLALPETRGKLLD
jgi:MFS family permease